MWCAAAPSEILDCTVQLRAHGDEHRATVTVTETGFEVELLDPAFGIAPGQACMIYQGTKVIGSGTIARTHRTSEVQAEVSASSST